MIIMQAQAFTLLTLKNIKLEVDIENKMIYHKIDASDNFNVNYPLHSIIERGDT